MGFDGSEVKESKKTKAKAKQLSTSSIESQGLHGVPYLLMMIVGFGCSIYGLGCILLEFASEYGINIAPIFLGCLFITMGIALFYVGNKYRSQHDRNSDSFLSKINQYCTNKLRLGRAILAAPIILITIMAIFLTVVPNPQFPERVTPSRAPSVEDLSFTAFIQCQQHIRARLKAPSTAKFPFGVYKYWKHKVNTQFTIVSYVDSQNSFSAMIRTRWSCKIKNTFEDNWELIDVQILE